MRRRMIMMFVVTVLSAVMASCGDDEKEEMLLGTCFATHVDLYVEGADGSDLLDPASEACILDADRLYFNTVGNEGLMYPAVMDRISDASTDLSDAESSYFFLIKNRGRYCLQLMYDGSRLTSKDVAPGNAYAIEISWKASVGKSSLVLQVEDGAICLDGVALGDSRKLPCNHRAHKVLIRMN